MMGEKYVGNSLSLNMFYKPIELDIHVSRISEKRFREETKDAYSIFGHKDLAELLGYAYNRVSVELKNDDVLYVAQYVGERLPEGATELPENAKIEYYKVISHDDTWVKKAKLKE